MSDREYVVVALNLHNLSQTWLITMLAKRGIDVGKVNLSDFIRGVRVNATSAKVLAEAKTILQSYERWGNEFNATGESHSTGVPEDGTGKDEE